MGSTMMPTIFLVKLGSVEPNHLQGDRVKSLHYASNFAITTKWDTQHIKVFFLNSPFSVIQVRPGDGVGLAFFLGSRWVEKNGPSERKSFTIIWRTRIRSRQSIIKRH
jgi:hypothetical protein